MNKELIFDKEKYLKSAVQQILIIILIFIIIFLFFYLNNKASLLNSDWKILLLLLFFFILGHSCKLVLNYKYYLTYFKCTYNNESLTYDIIRFASIKETLFDFFVTIVAIHLEVDKIYTIERKRGKIIINGKMTIEQSNSKTQIKIINKYLFPDYFSNTEKFLEIYNK